MGTAKNKPAPSTQSTGLKNLVPWAPGVSGNPGGRPKTRHISEALRQKLDAPVEDGRTYAQVIADRLVNTAAYAKRDSQATEAAEAIASRIEGKPVQAVQFEQTVDENTLKRLMAIAERLGLGAPVIEGTLVAPALEGNCAATVQQSTQVIDGQAPDVTRSIGDS
jgi:hypothetical protein